VADEQDERGGRAAALLNGVVSAAAVERPRVCGMVDRAAPSRKRPARPARFEDLPERGQRGIIGGMATIEAGDKAPAFSLPDQDGVLHRLRDYAGKPLILYFYPKDDTPGCTREACAFQDALPKFGKSKAVVLGVSILDTASKAKFAKKHGLTFRLLADADHETADRYGVWKKKALYGRQFMGLVRTTFLIGPDGKIARRWDNVKVDGHAADVLAAANAL
jgi:peroxiredoxin Q/BCP